MARDLGVGGAESAERIFKRMDNDQLGLYLRLWGVSVAERSSGPVYAMDMDETGGEVEPFQYPAAHYVPSAHLR
jgi:hypothetical protein